MRIKSLFLIGIVTISFAGLIYFFGIGGAIAGIFESLLVFVLSNPEKAMGYLATFYKQLRDLSFWFEKNAVEKRLESTIGLSRKKVNEEGIELLEHKVDVRWSEPENRDVFLEEGKIVVCLEPSVNEARNLARATMLYASRDLIRESQRFVNPNVMRAACLAVSRKMLMIERRLDAFKCLNEEFLEPQTNKHPSIKGYVEAMEQLDSEGCLTRLLLKEFSELDAKLSPAISDPRAERESVSFMQTLGKLAKKQEGIDINPTHRGKIIDVSVMLVAREGIKDSRPYIRYAGKCWNEGVPRLYVLAQGKNVVVALSTVIAIRTKEIYRVEKEWNFWIPRKRGGFKSYVAVLSRIAR